MNTGNGIRIESLAVYLPPRRVSTSEVVGRCRTEIKFPLEQLTGIRSRPVAGDGEYSIDLAAKAVSSCLAESRYAPDEIDLLICCSISRCDGPDSRFSFEPSTSSRIKGRYAFRNAVAFDISNACAGVLTAVAIANAFIKSGSARTAMIVSGEYITHLTLTAQKEIDSFLDPRMACLTLGDAGAALIVERSPVPEIGFQFIDLHTRAEYSSLCVAKATEHAHGGAIMYTDSIRLSAAAIRHAASHAIHGLRDSGWVPSEIEHLIMHQTSKMTLNDAASEINRILGGPVCHDGNVVCNLAERGNTATTSHLVALVDLMRDGTIKSGQKVMLSSTGSGLTIGTALYRFDDLPDRIRAGRRERSESATGIKGPRPGGARNAAVPRVRIESIGTVPMLPITRRETTALAKAAAEDCLSRSPCSRHDIGLLIFAGVYRTDFLLEPAVAALVAEQLGLGREPDAIPAPRFLAFDVFNGSLGFLNACYVAIQLMNSRKPGLSMIVTSEIENNLEAWRVQRLGIEETGSALLLVADNDAGTCGFGPFYFKSYDEHADALVAYTGRYAGEPCIQYQRDPRLEACYQECIVDAITDFLATEKLDLSRIDLVFLPQVSPGFVEGLRARLSIPKERCVNAAKPGHDLFTSSLPVALRHAQVEGIVRSGAVGLIVAVGSGIQVGCALYHF